MTVKKTGERSESNKKSQIASLICAMWPCFFSFTIILKNIIKLILWENLGRLYREVAFELGAEWWGISLVAQMVKNLSAMQETWVRSLGQEDILEKEKATHSSNLA